MLQLIQIGVQMFHADLVIGTNKRAFKKAPNTFDSIRVNIPAHPLFRAVIDSLMPRVGVRNSFVGREFIRVNRLRLRIGVLPSE